MAWGQTWVSREGHQYISLCWWTISEFLLPVYLPLHLRLTLSRTPRLSILAMWCGVLVLVGTKNTLLNTVLKVPKSIFPLWGWHFNLLSGFTCSMGTPGGQKWSKMGFKAPIHRRVLLKMKMKRANQIYCFNHRKGCLLFVPMTFWPLNYPQYSPLHLRSEGRRWNP